MKTHIFLLLTSLFLVKGTFAQAPDTLWTKVLAGYVGNSVRQTSDEGYIIAGATVNTEALLIKTNFFGDTIWTKTYGGGKFRSVKQTIDNGFIATGQTTSGTEDILITKTNSIGEVLWNKTYGGTRADWASDVQQTYDGNYIVVGSNSSFAFPNGRLWLLKTDTNGDTLWTKFFGGDTPYNIGLSVCQTRDSGYVITGYTSVTGNSIDVWIIKTNPNGELDWMKTYGGALWDQGNSVKQAQDDGYIIVGETESFGAGNSDVWLIKTDTFGDTLWTRTFGGVDLDKGNSVQQTYDGGYIIAGTSESFEPGNPDLLLIKTDSDGETIWTSTYGGIDLDEGYSVQQTTDNGYIVSGSTYSNGSLGKYVWLLRISSDPSNVNEGENFQPQDFALYQNYPNPFNPLTTIKFALPVESKVKINVYNSLGQLVETLVNKEMASGYHEVNFDASRYSSGVYLYQLRAGDFISVKKMIVLK
jgi:hypothetical protein